MTHSLTPVVMAQHEMISKTQSPNQYLNKKSCTLFWSKKTPWIYTGINWLRVGFDRLFFLFRSGGFGCRKGFLGLFGYLFFGEGLFAAAVAVWREGYVSEGPSTGSGGGEGGQGMSRTERTSSS